MNKLVVAIGLIMTLAMAAVAEWPCQPNQIAAKSDLAAFWYKCEDLNSRCTWAPPWDYFHQFKKQCEYWCCYDSQGYVVGTVLIDCFPQWSEAGCCAQPNPGYTWNPPDCPGVY